MHEIANAMWQESYAEEHSLFLSVRSPGTPSKDCQARGSTGFDCTHAAVSRRQRVHRLTAAWLYLVALIKRSSAVNTVKSL